MKSGMYKDAARSRCLKGAITQVLALTIQSRPGITWGKSSKVGEENGNRKQHIPVAVLAGIKQGNHAIAKMTARCAQYVSALKIAGLGKRKISRRLRKNLHITIRW